ncbi:hypothetical protein DPX39_010013200 [Trypanosoma brucei equiperdum]|uniref:Uncharacterized protein n=1 Tax=Trypanosoma brucei equiperdum TaxID=630700 RepID=A0A3L6LC81_9TRYP|nr:hypothetical protein DPX39_010013200 [Trypanosoma brucei equiperdum]
MMRRKREESAEGKERCGYDGYPSNPQQSAVKKQGLHLLGGGAFYGRPDNCDQ